MKLAVALSLAAVIFVMATTFVTSLPNFCANPNGSGNWIVQPICEK